MKQLIIEGIDGSGKTTLAEKVANKYNLKIIHSTAKTRNDLNYHIDLLDYNEDCVFDRFHFGEYNVFPKLYNRECKLNFEDWDKINKKIIDNNATFVVMVCSDMSIIDKRLIERGELEYIPEVREQNKLFLDACEDFKKYNYKHFYICDIAEENAYDKLDNWLAEHFGKITPNIAYRQICRDLIDKGHIMETRNIRGNTKELCNYTFVIDDISDSVLSLSTAKASYPYIAAETLWYWNSRNDLEFISKFSKMWEKVSDDGKTCNSAYGYILQEKHGFNQIEKIIELLRVDPYSRRAVLNINVPNENVINTKDEMCTIALIYQIRENKLHCTCIFRSNDINYGVKNDLAFFLQLQQYIADKLNIAYGTYTHFAASMHMYDRDYKQIKDVATGTLDSKKEKLNIKELIKNNDYLMDYIDNHWNNREEFINILKDKNIITEN